MDPDDLRILGHVDEDYLLWLLRHLVQIPSVNPPCQLGPIARAVAGELVACGLGVEVAGDAGDGWDRPNVLGILPGEGSAWGLLLSAHTDVVPAYDLHQWQHDPFAADVASGVVYGRGTADCKGSLAAMIAAVRALVHAGVRLQRGVVVLAWAGDEWHPPDAQWFNGETYMATNDYLRPALYLGGEPYDLQICCASRGRLWPRIVVGGESTHSASGAGVNAILGAAEVIKAIAGLPLGSHPILGRDTINVGMVRGGVQPNIVPDRCEVTFDLRFAMPLTVARVREIVLRTLDDLREQDGLEIRETAFLEQREPIEFPSDGALVRALRDSGRVALGRELPLGGAVSFGDIADWKDKVGIEEAVLFGPGQTAQAHAVNEHVVFADVVAAAKVYALTAWRCCKNL